MYINTYVHVNIYTHVSLICRRRLKSSPRTLAYSKDLKISSQLYFFLAESGADGQISRICAFRFEKGRNLGVKFREILIRTFILLHVCVVIFIETSKWLKGFGR